MTTHEVLTSGGLFSHIHLKNAQRLVYKLSVLAIHPESNTIEVARISGRSKPLDPRDHWQITLCGEVNAFQGQLLGMTEHTLSFTLRLPPELRALEPRRQVRFSVQSRHPIVATFETDTFHHHGEVVDISEEGLGVLLDRPEDLKIGTQVYNLQCLLLGKRLPIAVAEVVHRQEAEGALSPCRIGLTFATGKRQKDEWADAFKLAQRKQLRYTLAADPQLQPT